MAKPKLKKKAIKLRKQGHSYGEILEEVSVAKSTLSLWLTDIDLTKEQKQRLTEKKIAAAKKGQEIRRKERIRRTKEIKKKAKKEIGEISERDLWMLGIALYWAEGTKEKICGGRTNSAPTEFANSDERIIKIFLKWLQEVCEISSERINFRISLHKNAKSKKNKVRRHWSKVTGFPLEKFQDIIWKEHRPKTNRKNTGDDYYGLLAIRIEKSTDFTRKIAGWIEGICE